MAILYDWYENPGASDDSEERGWHPRIFLNGKVGMDKLELTYAADLCGCDRALRDVA